MTGEGDCNNEGENPGDLIIKINLLPDFYFQRKGYDLYSNLQISVPDAVLGVSVKVRTLKGER
jgi:DnaJ-class molecular chaperone